MSQKAKWTARNHFAEYLKTSYVPPSQPFTPGEDEDEDEDDDEEPEVIYECPVPGVPDDGKVVQKGFLCLTQQDMDGFFDPIFSEITQLVQKQVDGAELRCRNKVTVNNLDGIV